MKTESFLLENNHVSLLHYLHVLTVRSTILTGEREDPQCKVWTHPSINHRKVNKGTAAFIKYMCVLHKYI